MLQLECITQVLLIVYFHFGFLPQFLTNAQHVHHYPEVCQIKGRKVVYQLAVRDGKALVNSKRCQENIAHSSGAAHPIAVNSAINRRHQEEVQVAQRNTL